MPGIDVSMLCSAVVSWLIVGIYQYPLEGLVLSQTRWILISI